MNYKTLVRAAQFRPDRLKYPGSWVGHIPFVSWLISEAKPSLIVELGTHSGNSYNAICQAVKKNDIKARCFAIDTWRGDEHAGPYAEDVYLDLLAYQKENYTSFSTLLRMTFDEAISHFENHTIDLLHIDGLHTYEAVSHDFYSWLPKLSENAFVLFHDVDVKVNGFGVWRFWEQIKEAYNYTFEFPHSHGLGVLHISEKIALNSFADKLFSASSCEMDDLIGYFSSIGAVIHEKVELENILENTKYNTSRAEKLEGIIQEQSAELDVRLKLIQDTDQARKDQLERAEKLEGIVLEQSAELDARLKVIEQTDQARKDQLERAEKLEGIVQEQSAELDVRLKVIEQTDQARRDQLERAEKLEKQLTTKDLAIQQLHDEVADLLSGEIRALKNRSEDE